MKKAISVGFSFMPEPYEPIKINVSIEREENEVDTIALAGEVKKALQDVSEEFVASIQKLKKEIMDELSDEE